MNWYVHDTSLRGQYPTSASFLSCIAELLKLRLRYLNLHQGLKCSRLIADQPVTAVYSFRQVVQSCTDKNLRRLILQWFDSSGPFWEDDREVAEDDYFQLNGLDITNHGAGEAARQILKGKLATAFSFQNGGFDYSPLKIQHGLDEQPLGQIDVPNLWDSIQLEASALAKMPVPTNWNQAIDLAKLTFPSLHFADNLMDHLRREPFTAYLAERIFELLKRLQEFVNSRNPDGTYSAATMELIATFFAGGKALFTDESENNKRNFEKLLTFKDVENPKNYIFCPWHGKIKTPQFRVHFPWPLLQDETRLRILYIGPKITKD